MRKKMTEETKKKIKDAKDANEKKVLEISGYEIWRDPVNYTVCKDGKNLYFSTFENALKEVREELIRNKLAGSETLDVAIKRIKEIDSEFIDALSACVDKLGQE